MGRQRGIVGQAADEGASLFFLPILFLLVVGALIFLQPYWDQIVAAYDYVYGGFIKPLSDWMEPGRELFRKIFG